MKEAAQEAVIAGLARRLQDRGSWCGETHLQKAAYLLREFWGVPFGFDFILYKHGPFSFGLRDELGSMRADGLLERVPQPRPYGPKIQVTEHGRGLEARFAKTMRQYGPSLDWIAERLGDRGVFDLERLATAMWVTRHAADDASVPDRAAELNGIKPHVRKDEAEAAIEEIDEMVAELAG